MSKRLVDIFADGFIKDNSEYHIQDKLLNGTVQINFTDRRKGRNHWSLWCKLHDEFQNINEFLKSSDTENLTLFKDGEYEHNTDDPFYEISGRGIDDFTFKTGNVVGYVKKDETELSISSRFGDQFLKYIISDTDGFLELEDKGGLATSNKHEWLIVYLWLVKLKKAYRLGVPKSYITITEATSKPRGSIDVMDYFLNKHSAKVKCTYREHSFDNPATRLISEVFRKLVRHDFIKNEPLLRNTFFNATKGGKTPLREALTTPDFTNPYYNDYNEVIRLSKLILKNEHADFGQNSKTSAFLFDVSMLFEYFVKKQIKQLGLAVENKSSEPKRIETGLYQRKIEPDLVFSKNNMHHVYDVKYKSFDWSHTGGVKREDLFQLHTYVGQYMNTHNVHSCGFIYPCSESAYNQNLPKHRSGLIQQKIQVGNKDVDFNIIFVKIPSEALEPKEFNKAFTENLRIVKQHLNNITCPKEHTK